MSDNMCSNDCGNDVDHAICAECAKVDEERQLAASKRESEQAFKRGFDAGVAHQKKAAPSPKAKQYRDALKAAAEALREVLARKDQDDGDPTSERWDHDLHKPYSFVNEAIAAAEELLR